MWKLLLYLVLLLPGCASRSQEEITVDNLAAQPRAKTIVSALETFSDYEEKGLVPELAMGDRYDLKTPEYDMSTNDDFPYPQTIQFDLRKQDDRTQLYSYVLSRKNRTERWRLVEAWRADSNGNKVILLAPRK